MQENKMGTMPIDKLIIFHVSANHDLHAGTALYNIVTVFRGSDQ